MITSMAPLLDDIRAALKASGQSRYAIAKATSISQAHLCQFVKGTKGLSVEAAEVLAEHLGLELVARPKRAKAKPRAQRGRKGR